MRSSKPRIVASCAATLSILYFAGVIRKANTEIRHATAKSEIPFSTHTLDRTSTPMADVSLPAVFLDIAIFQDRIYITTPAALLQYTPDGVPQHRWRSGQELPPDDAWRSIPVDPFGTANLPATGTRMEATTSPGGSQADRYPILHRKNLKTRTDILSLPAGC